VGSHKPSRFSGRVIAATNRPLEELRVQKVLRDDFYYRLCSDVIVLPSLAQRISEDEQELRDLLIHTVTRILGKPSPELTDMLCKLVLQQPGKNYHWPGNVRELEQCVRRIMLNQAYEPEKPGQAVDMLGCLIQGLRDGSLEGQALLSGYCFSLYQKLGAYEAVARRARLDRRTVKKYVEEGGRLFKMKENLNLEC
jgi:transcriptional regulator with PAS, ATPase and Fis domain